MDVNVNQDLCISCGLCVSNCPEVFSWNDEDKAQAFQERVDSALEECIQDAADSCPTDAIETN